MAYIDVDLEDADTSDLIEALERKHLNKSDRENILSLLSDNEDDYVDIDQIQKLDVIMRVLHFYTLEQIRDIFAHPIELIPYVNNPNQLKLEI